MAQADDLKKLQDALRSGDYNPTDIQDELVRSGYKPSDAQDMMRQAMQGDVGGSSRPSIFSRIMGAASLGGPEGNLDAIPGGIANSLQQTTDAWRDMFTGGAKSDTLAKMVPLIGPAMKNISDQLFSGNGQVPEGIGGLLGMIGPEVAGVASEGLGAAGKAAGPYAYRSKLPFGSGVSRADIVNATRQGIEKEYVAPSLFGKGPNALDRMGVAGKSGDLDTLSQQIEPYVTGINGAHPADMSTLFGPILQKLKPLAESPLAGGQKVAGDMLDQIRPTVEKMSKPFADILYESDPKTGQPLLTPSQKANALDAWTGGVGRKSTITVKDAHQIRQDAYKTLNAGAFSDKATDAAANTRDAAKNLAVGAKNAVAEVHPQVSPLLEQQHNTLTLQRALTDASKANPQEFELLKNLAIGISLGGGAHLAGGSMAESGGAGALGIIAIKAAQSPALATRLGILLGKKFPAVNEALQPILHSASIAGKLGILGNQPTQPPIQSPPNQ